MKPHAPWLSKFTSWFFNTSPEWVASDEDEKRTAQTRSMQQGSEPQTAPDRAGDEGQEPDRPPRSD